MAFKDDDKETNMDEQFEKDLEEGILSSNGEETPKKPNGKIQDPSVALANKDSQNLVEFFTNELGGSSAVRVKIIRKTPTLWKGKNIAGLIETIDELISEEEIKERWGGGKYTVQAQRRSVKGTWQYVTQREVMIAGDPKIEHLMEPTEPKPVNPLIAAEEGSLQKHAMNMLERSAIAERERADRLEREMHDNARAIGLDPAILELIKGPLTAQAEAAQRRADSLEREMRALREEAVKPPPANPMMERIFEKTVSDDQARMSALRDMHEKEIRTVRENHVGELRSVKDAAREDLKRAEDRADKMIDSLERQHAREMDNTKQGFVNQLESIKASNEARSAVLEGENRRLLKEIEEKKAELTELRLKKDKPLTEQIIELAQMQEAIGALKGEDEPQSTFDKVMERFGPVAEAVAQRMGQAPAPQVAVPNPGVSTKVMKKKVAVAPPARTQIGNAPPPIAPEDIRLAVQYIEGAIQNDQDPVVFASSIQSVVSGGVIQAIKQVGGVDKFINEKVQLGQNSPLHTPNGRNFIRKMERALLGDHDPE